MHAFDTAAGQAALVRSGEVSAREPGLRPVTESVRLGITRNPHDLPLSAGGSSGGSAAAVAAGIVALADGWRWRDSSKRSSGLHG